MRVDKEDIKRLILTDYLDNRLAEHQKYEMDRIIAEDKELTDFLREARNKTITPFSSTPAFHAPERIWVSVEDRLDELPSPVKIRFWSRWLMGWPRPSLMWAEVSFALVLILVMTFARIGRQPFVRYDKDSQIEYLMFLTQGPTGSGPGAGEPKTNIEKYFL
ncbi:MAG: hypothetical protein WC450_07625 [Candidatus Omnitrophota bacterium]|jgi:hypothetical protein